MNGDEFGIYYRAELAQARVAAARRGIAWRLGSTVFLILLELVLWYSFPEVLAQSGPWLVGSTAVVGVAYLAYEGFRFFQARSEAARVPPSLAIGLNRDGMLIGERWYPWGQIGSLVVRPGRLGSSSRLVATGRDASTEQVLIDYTDVLPASLDSAVVALSGGRARVDLSRLDA